MSKLRNIILFLFGTHRLGPRPQQGSPNVAPIFLHPQKPNHEAVARTRTAAKRPRRRRKGRGDAAFDDSSTDDAFGSANSGSEDLTTAAASPAESSRTTYSSDQTASDSDDDDILDGSPHGSDADWSPTSSRPSADPYRHYLQEEGVAQVEPGTTTTRGTPSTRPPTTPSTATPSTNPSTTTTPSTNPSTTTIPSTTTPSTTDWSVDHAAGPRLFPPPTCSTTTRPPRSMAGSTAEFYGRSPKIPVRHNATSTLRQEQIQQVKKRLASLGGVGKRRRFPVKCPWPVITPRDWREMNGIRVGADRFEKDEYVMEDGQLVKKYESRRWKEFVQEIKLSVDRLAQVTKIHMPLPLPPFIITLMEEVDYD